MRQLIGKFEVVDGFGNQKTLKVFTNRQVGTVDFDLTSNRTSC